MNKIKNIEIEELQELGGGNDSSADYDRLGGVLEANSKLDSQVINDSLGSLAKK